MIPRRASTQLFGMSFLDVLFCALGGAVMLLFYTMIFDREQLRLQIEKTLAAETDAKLQQAELSTSSKLIEDLKRELVLNAEQAERELLELTAEHERLRLDFEAETACLDWLLLEADRDLTAANNQHENDRTALQGRIDEQIGLLDSLRGQLDRAEDDASQAGQATRRAERKFNDLMREHLKYKDLVVQYQRDMELGREREKKLRFELLIRDKRLQDEWALRLKAEQLALSREKDLERLNVRIDSTQYELASLVTEQQQLKALIDGAIGLNGPMKHVVFVFDTSESLGVGDGAEERFAAYKELLKAWVRTLPMDSFSIVRYSTAYETPTEWGDTLVPADEAHRLAACEFIDGFIPKGRTRTHDALKYASELSDVDTVILFSDGEPTDENGNTDPDNGDNQPGPLITEVLDYFRNRKSNDDAEIVINCVAMGNYLNQRYGQFLRNLAQENEGIFIGR